MKVDQALRYQVRVDSVHLFRLMIACERRKLSFRGLMLASRSKVSQRCHYGGVLRRSRGAKSRLVWAKLGSAS